MITIKDMAEELGISTTTVSNVIHGKTSEVSKKTVERVEALLEKYNYVPNINARNLAQNCSRIIGVAIKGRKDKYENILADPFFGTLIGDIEAEIRAKGYFMMLYTSDNVVNIINDVSSWNADGLIMIGMLNDDYIRFKNKYRKPLVLIDSYAPRDVAQYVNIGLEDEEGAYMMTRYLLEMGHRKIAFLADNMTGVDHIRYQGYQRALREYGLPANDDGLIILHPIDMESCMDEVYERASSYTALFCCSDYYAVTVMHELQKRGVRFPEDLSITGFDNNLLASIVTPGLTTVSQDVGARGRLAVRTLVDMIDGRMPEENNINLPVELKIRDSVRRVEKA